jgi:colanic acid biosynthesis glycosyl transferase WcaI
VQKRWLYEAIASFVLFQSPEFMRILIYSYNYYPEPIGIAPLMTELAEGLAKRGHLVRIVTGMPNYPERRVYDGYRNQLYCTEERNGVTIQRSYIWIRPKPGLLTRILFDGSFVVTSLGQALNGWRPDVVLLTVPPLPVAVPASLLGWLYSCPVILNLQDILPEAAVHVGLLKNKIAIRVFEALEKYAYRTATAISVITPEFSENLMNKGVPAQKLHCIPNWVNTSFIRPLLKENTQFRTTHQLQDKFVVLYSGNIALTQGLETVIDAASHLQHIPDIVIVIVGESKSLDRLKAYCQERNVENVLLLPFQPREQLPDMLSAADVGLVVQKQSVISFNMPSKIQTLLASGCPIVASVPSSNAAAQTVLRSGGGIVVEAENPTHLADAILHLYQNPATVKALGLQGRRYAIDNYEFSRRLDQYEVLFSKLTQMPIRLIESIKTGDREIAGDRPLQDEPIPELNSLPIPFDKALQ